MFMKSYLSSIILLLCVHLSQSQTTTEETISPSPTIATTTNSATSSVLTGSTTSSPHTTTTTSSVPATTLNSSVITTSTATFTSTTLVTSSSVNTSSSASSTTSQTPTNTVTMTGTTASTMTTATVAANGTTGMTATGSTATSTVSNTTSAANTVTGTTSAVTNVTSIVINTTTALTNVTSTVTSTTTTTTLAIKANINATYKYIIQSELPLKNGSIIDINATISVQNLVNVSFNLRDFTFEIQQIRIIQQLAKAPTLYDLFVDILFKIYNTNCDLTCIDAAQTNATINVTLPLENGTSVLVYTVSGARRETTDSPTVNYIMGGPSPGVPAQIGMGLGISLFGVLIIAEIAFFYWKYKFSNRPRREAYAMTHRS